MPTNFRMIITVVLTLLFLPSAFAGAQNPTPIYPVQGVPATLDGQYMAPGRGLTRDFEIQFLEFTIDHHYSALRITELAAGTDLQRNPVLSASEGTSPTPGYPPTTAKANLSDLRSLARRNNRMQREEILTLQSYLQQWYGITYEPHITSDGETMINILENAQAGRTFDLLFFEVFSRHHFMLLDRLNQCLTGSDLAHPDLASSCKGMWHSQVSDIDTMRREMARHYGIVDYQPFTDPKGRHSAPER